MLPGSHLSAEHSAPGARAAEALQRDFMIPDVRNEDDARRAAHDPVRAGRKLLRATKFGINRDDVPLAVPMAADGVAQDLVMDLVGLRRENPRLRPGDLLFGERRPRDESRRFFGGETTYRQQASDQRDDLAHGTPRVRIQSRR